MKKKTKAKKSKKLLLSTEKVRDLKPVDDDKLNQVAGGDFGSASRCSGSGTVSW